MKTLRCVFAVTLVPVLLCSGSASAALVINEIHADPATGSAGDANGDGVRQTYGDEFIEIGKLGAGPVNLSGYTLSDNSGTSPFTFPEGTSIAENEIIVLFGGGTPTGTPGQVFVDDNIIGNGLANTGDTVELRNASGELVASYTYGSEGGENESLTRYPDGTGNFVKHLSGTPSSARFSPGRTIGGDTSLPVLLSDFQAIAGDSQVTLYWVTESEVDNLKFRVWLASEQDGEYSWIGEVEGAGSSASVRQYTFVVRRLNNGQIYWFRLEDVSFDGTSTLHEAKSARPVALTPPEPKGGVPSHKWGTLKARFQVR